MAVDMETATLFTTGFFNHIPTGALLLVSDQPMIPEGVKTEKSDSMVTRNFVDEHVEIGIDSLRMIIDEKKHPGRTKRRRVTNQSYSESTSSSPDQPQEWLQVVLGDECENVATILQPMDVIKTRQQGYYHKATLQNGSVAENKQFLRWQVAAKNIYKERGVVGYWDGLVWIR